MNLQSPVVVDEPELPKFIHGNTDPRPARYQRALFGLQRTQADLNADPRKPVATVPLYVSNALFSSPECRCI